MVTNILILSLSTRFPFPLNLPLLLNLSKIPCGRRLWMLNSMPFNKMALGSSFQNPLMFPLAVSGYFVSNEHQMVLLISIKLALWRRVFILEETGRHYFKTSSPIAKPITMRIVFCLALSLIWLLHQLDVSNAFLHGTQSKDIYIV